jgi:hypothetical protein
MARPRPRTTAGAPAARPPEVLAAGVLDWPLGGSGRRAGPAANLPRRLGGASALGAQAQAPPLSSSSFRDLTITMTKLQQDRELPDSDIGKLLDSMLTRAFEEDVARQTGTSFHAD